MIEITYILFVFTGVFVVTTILYRRRFKKKEEESDYFTYHYIEIRNNKKDTGLTDAIKYHHTDYENRIHAWEKPVFGKMQNNTENNYKEQ